MELSDLHARTVCINTHTPIETTVDALLRMQNSKNWKRPITLYLGLGNAGPIGMLDTLTLCDVLRSLLSPVHTFGFGLIHEPLLLAAGSRGHRYVLPHTLLSAGPIEPDHLPLPNGQFGLSPNHTGPSLRVRAGEMILDEFHNLSRELGISPELWTTPKILSAPEIIRAGLADQLVPALQPDLRIATSPTRTLDAKESTHEL